jgi:hypothetical protein
LPLLLFLPLPLLFSCHPSPKAEDLLLLLPILVFAVACSFRLSFRSAAEESAVVFASRNAKALALAFWRNKDVALAPGVKHSAPANGRASKIVCEARKRHELAQHVDAP